MHSIKFNIQGEVVEVDEEVVKLSILLSTTMNTNLRVDLDDEGIPIVEIVTKDDIDILIKYYKNGEISHNIVEAFDRLIVEPRITKLDKLKYYWLDKLCPVPLRDQMIIAPFLPILDDICKHVRRFQDYGILLDEYSVPETYTFIPIDVNGPRGKVLQRYLKPTTKVEHVILNDICYNAYDTLRKYKRKYMLVISDTPTMYSIHSYIINYVLPLRQH